MTIVAIVVLVVLVAAVLAFLLLPGRSLLLAARDRAGAVQLLEWRRGERRPRLT